MSFIKHVGKNKSKNLIGKYIQKLLNHAKQLATDLLKTSSKTIIKKAAKATSDLSGNKTADALARSYDGKITKISKNSKPNNSETVTIENDQEISKQICIPREKTN